MNYSFLPLPLNKTLFKQITEHYPGVNKVGIEKMAIFAPPPKMKITSLFQMLVLNF